MFVIFLIVITNYVKKKLIYTCACYTIFKDVSQALVDLTVHHSVHIRNTELNVKELVTVGATCVMFPQDVQMFLQVIKCSISQIYAEELLFNYALC